MIWFCDLDDPTEDLYKNRPPTPNVITAEDVAKIQGEVASPAELKKRIDDLKTGYDQKILAIEKEQNIVRGLLIAIIVACLGVYIRSLFESKKSVESPPAAATPTEGGPVGGSPAIESTRPIQPSQAVPAKATQSAKRVRSAFISAERPQEVTASAFLPPRR